MQSFEFTIRDALGIHARPAGLLVKAANNYKETAVTLEKDGKQADMKKLFRIMSLSVKQGNLVKVSTDGPQEVEAIKEIQAIFDADL